MKIEYPPSTYFLFSQSTQHSSSFHFSMLVSKEKRCVKSKCAERNTRSVYCKPCEYEHGIKIS